MKRPKKGAPKFDVRPVSSLALKSGMDTLRPFLGEAHVLDLFAGLGRFGFYMHHGLSGNGYLHFFQNSTASHDGGVPFYFSRDSTLRRHGAFG